MATTANLTNLTRIRENQRRSRARRKQYLQELEQRLRLYELKGVEASSEVQKAARRVLDDNGKLRVLLNKYGMSDDAIDGSLRSSPCSSSATPAVAAAAAAVAVTPGGGPAVEYGTAAQKLDLLLAPRCPNWFDGNGNVPPPPTTTTTTPTTTATAVSTTMSISRPLAAVSSHGSTNSMKSMALDHDRGELVCPAFSPNQQPSHPHPSTPARLSESHHLRFGESHYLNRPALRNGSQDSGLEMDPSTPAYTVLDGLPRSHSISESHMPETPAAITMELMMPVASATHSHGYYERASQVGNRDAHLFTSEYLAMPALASTAMTSLPAAAVSQEDGEQFRGCFEAAPQDECRTSSIMFNHSIGHYAPASGMGG